MQSFEIGAWELYESPSVDKLPLNNTEDEMKH